MGFRRMERVELSATESAPEPVQPMACASLIAEGSALNHWLSKFVLEARKADGEPYPPNTLYQICSGLLRRASR